MGKVLNSILETIGQTPIVRLDRVKNELGLKGNIYAKLEYMNPGGSKKDRIAKYIVEKAKKDGILKDKQEVAEATSGNTGIGLALVCTVLKHPFTAFISSGNSEERVMMMKAFGANVVIVEQTGDKKYGEVTGNDFDCVKDEARRYSEENNCFFINQFENHDNIEAQEIFGNEIVECLNSADITLDYFCDFVGTGGAFTGCSKALKKWNPNIECYVVEPENCDALKSGVTKKANHIIQGGGYGYPDLALIDKEMIIDFITVSNDDAKLGFHLLTRAEGIFGSISSGANLIAGIKLVMNKEKNVLITVCDTGLKYLSTGIISIV